MNTETKNSLKTYLLEFLVYGALMTLYYFAVLRLTGGWLLDLFQHHREKYAVVALGLVVGQGFLLEVVTRGLVRVFKSRTEI